MNTNYALIAGIMVCGALFYLANTGRYFGAWVNKIRPCVQEPMTSFPCYGVYDIGAMIFAVVVGIVLLGVLVFRLFR